LSSADGQISVGQQLSFPPGVRISVTSEELPANAQHRRWRVTGALAGFLGGRATR